MECNSTFNNTIEEPNLMWTISEVIQDITIQSINKIPFFIAFVIFYFICSKLYYMAKDRLEEMNVFNVDYMSEEEKKLFYYTRRLTFINEKNIGKATEISANKGKFFKLVSNEIYLNDYKYAPPIKKCKTINKEERRVIIDDKNLEFFD